ncbi:MAG TPA: hypothetical protein VFU90_05550, partial [Candidatus Tumulicola sp.]|nr:hypothetical protein [Candidatus Tumulicola sp.]
FYGKNNNVHLADKQALITFMVSANAARIIKKLEYTPLSGSVHTAIINAMNGSGSKAPCLQ